MYPKNTAAAGREGALLQPPLGAKVARNVREKPLFNQDITGLAERSSKIEASRRQRAGTVPERTGWKEEIWAA
jgi:hypothetical protein